MIFGQRLRSLLPLVLDSDNIVHVSDTGSQGATELCGEFYGTLAVLLCGIHFQSDENDIWMGWI